MRLMAFAAGLGLAWVLVSTTISPGYFLLTFFGLAIFGYILISIGEDGYRKRDSLINYNALAFYGYTMFFTAGWIFARFIMKVFIGFLNA